MLIESFLIFWVLAYITIRIVSLSSLLNDVGGFNG